MFRSTDAGSTWTRLAPLPIGRCTRALVHPANPDVVYLAGDAGLYKSTNGGLDWGALRTDHIWDVLLDPANPETVYAAVWNVGIFKSTRGGSPGSWRQLLNGLPDNVEWIKLAMGRNGSHGTALLIAHYAIRSLMLVQEVQ